MEAITTDMWIIFALLFVAVILFINERISFDVTALIILSTLLLTGILSPEEGFSGFSNVATITIANMFILSEGLRRTGALNRVGAWFSELGKQNYWIAVGSMMLIIGAVSGFINNTAAVAIFIPIVIQVANDLDESPSRLLMPLSFAAMFGGVCTLIGTSTNILVSSIAEEHNLAAFSMFEFAPAGLIFFGVGMIYMFTAGIRLIPKRRKNDNLTENFEMSAYLTDVIIEPGAACIGTSVRDTDLLGELDLDIIRVFKKNQVNNSSHNETILEEGDVLRIRGSAKEINELMKREDMSLLPTKHWYDADLTKGQTALLEVVIAPDSAMQNKPLGNVDFYDRFGAFVLAVRRKGELQQDELEEVTLRGGDSLLLSCDENRIEEIGSDPSFVVSNRVQLPEEKSGRISVAMVILAGVVGSAAFGLTSIVISSTVGVVLMIITRCLSTEEAYKAINWKVIMLLGGVLPLGIAMEKTGAAELISMNLLDLLGDIGPVAIVSGFFFLSMMLTNIISNQATAALLAPIAIQAAHSFGIDPRPLLVSITMAASLSFMTPVGYQTNTLIYGPGQYKFTDFTKVGTPLNLIFWGLGTIVIPLFWPF